MRTTIELDDDTARAVDALRREQGIGTSEAVNTLLRRALLAAETPVPPFRQRTRRSPCAWTCRTSPTRWRRSTDLRDAE